MYQKRTKESQDLNSRRDFLKSTAGLSAAASLGSMAIPANAHAGGSDAIKIGLIGCGGRGTEAAVQRDERGHAMSGWLPWPTSSRSVLTPAATICCRRRRTSATFPTTTVSWASTPIEKVIAQRGRRGADRRGLAVLAPDVQAAMAAGKHVFCEKPHGIDVPGVNLVAAACRGGP